MTDSSGPTTQALIAWLESEAIIASELAKAQPAAAMFAGHLKTATMNRAAADALRSLPSTDELPVNLHDELHRVLTNHQIASRTEPALMSDLFAFFARAAKQTTTYKALRAAEAEVARLTDERDRFQAAFNNVLLRAERDELAVQALTQARDTQPWSVVAHFVIGGWKRDVSDIDGLTRAIEEGIAISPVSEVSVVPVGYHFSNAQQPEATEGALGPLPPAKED